MHGDLRKITLVVPCYNEAERLPCACLRAFMAGHPYVEILFVDDGSIDGTAEILNSLVAECSPRIQVLTFDHNQGKAEAVRQGILEAIDRADAPELVGYWDADMATPLEEVERFCRQFSGSDTLMVFGARVRRLGACIERRATRHLVGRAFATVVSLWMRIPVYDTQCGAKLFRSSLAKALFAKPFLSRWLFDVEMIVRAIKYLGRRDVIGRVVEVPLLRWEDVGGSKLSLGAFLRAPFELLRLMVHYPRLEDHSSGDD